MSKLTFLAPEPISLNDETEDVSEQTPWVKSVHIGEVSIQNDNHSKYALWTMLIELKTSQTVTVHKRYSDFDKLRNYLIKKHGDIIPKLPPKSPFQSINLDPKFLAKRRRGMEYFINCVLLNPIWANDDKVKTWTLGDPAVASSSTNNTATPAVAPQVIATSS